MRFTINSYSFRDGLNKILSVVDKRNSRPILTNYLINIHADCVEIVGTDLEVTSKVRIQANVEKGGSFCINSKNLFDIIKELPDADVSFSKNDDDNLLQIKCNTISYSLVIINTEDYPELNLNHVDNSFKLKTKDVINLINKTSHCISNDETRIYLNGIYIQSIDSFIRTVAIDGHRLALLDINEYVGDFSSLADGIIIPKKGVYELKKLADTADTEDISFSTDGSFLFVNSDELNFLSIRLISRDYPKYQTVIPSKTVQKMVVDKDQLVQAVKRIRILSNEKTHGIKFSLSKDILSINANHPSLGNASEEIPVEYDGEEISIGFNAKYVLDSLGVFEDKEIILEFNNELSPVIIKSDKLKEFLGIIMPLKL